MSTPSGSSRRVPQDDDRVVDRSSGDGVPDGTRLRPDDSGGQGDGRVEGREPVREEREPVGRTYEEETVAAPVPDRRPRPDPAPAPPPVTVGVEAGRRDQVRWGPVWAGLLVALATFVLLTLAAFMFGLLTPGGGDDVGVGESIVAGVLGLVAFFVGGLTAAATAMWSGVRSGLLHGTVVWALGVVSFLLLTVLGAGALLGPVADVLSQTTSLANVDPAAGVDVSSAVDTARETAGYALMSLGLAWVAAALGGLVGTKMWKGREDHDVDGVRVS